MLFGSFVLVNTARERGFYTIYRPEVQGTKERKIEMALTRKLLKGMGLTDEQVDTIIEAHTDTVDGLKADVTRYKTDAEKLKAVQKELDELKAAGDDGFEAKYNAEKKAFADYKAEVTAKEAKAAKEKAVRAYFESKNITGANLDLAMRGCGEEMAAIELADGKIKDTASLDALIGSTYKGLISTTTVKGADPATPPANAGNTGAGKYGDIYKKDDKGRYVMSAAERQKAIAEKMANGNE